MQSTIPWSGVTGNSDILITVHGTPQRDSSISSFCSRDPTLMSCTGCVSIQASLIALEPVWSIHSPLDLMQYRDSRVYFQSTILARLHSYSNLSDAPNL